MRTRTKNSYFCQIRVSQKLKDETERIASSKQESMSEYIRKAVEFRNENCNKKKELKFE